MGIDDFLALARTVEARAPLGDSHVHGSHHWRLVAWTGAELLAETEGADSLVVLFFALFHDSQRKNEYADPGHGRRGAALARDLLEPKRAELGDDRLQVLYDACSNHTKARPTGDPTRGVCWDSDRLNLWRVGKVPSARFLSTSAAKSPDRIAWARELQEQDFSWEQVAARYLGKS